jgi:Ca2+-binding EF-hand superfamily protein
MTPAAAAAPGRKSPVVVLLLCVATISLLMFILLSSYSPSLQPHGRSPHRRLKLHPKNSAAVASSYGTGESGGSGGQNHRAAPFDPAIAELERRLEDKEWEREHYRLLHGDGDEKDDHMKDWEEFLKEEEDFINDDERFNVSDRIRALFPKIDLDPQDGFVSLDELIRWNLEQARGDQLHRSAREMELYDKNGDGIVSFGDFQTLRKESHGNTMWQQLLNHSFIYLHSNSATPKIYY